MADHDDSETAAAPSTAAESLEDHAYFRAIEDHFLRLRGAPLMLSPSDWHVARRWHRQGIPLELVWRTLEEVFAKRRERAAKGRFPSLRYCAPAVQAAWAQHSELTAPGARTPLQAFDAAARLGALAAALPAAGEPPGVAALPAPAGRELRGELAALARSGLDPQAIEERLAALDREVLDGALAALAPEERAALDATVEKAIGAVAGRLPAAEIELARDRLARQVLRERLRLPVLSLFSPEALPPEPEVGEAEQPDPLPPEPQPAEPAKAQPEEPAATDDRARRP